MKTKLFYLFVGAIALTFAACEKESVSEQKQSPQMKTTVNNPTVNSTDLTPCVVANLMAGQHYDSGDLSVYVDLDNVYVEFKTTDNWYIRKTHLYVGNCQLIPRNNAGNPIPGQFPINNIHPGGTQTIAYTIPKTSLPPCFCIAAHAEVSRIENGVVVQTETAWAAGERFTQKGWATFFSICQDDCFDIEDYYFGKK